MNPVTNPTRYLSLFFGMAFGFLIAAAGFNHYDTIHNMLLLRELDAYLLMGSAVAVAMPLLWLLERRRWKTPFGGPLKIARYRMERKHVFGAMLFGTGWAIAGTCPVPALTMLASGSVLAVVVIGGFFLGIRLSDSVVAKQVTIENPIIENPAVDLVSAPVRQTP
jgi:hypothetical protein